MKQARVASSPPNGSSEAERRKRLGQYFTGVGLGRLLAALARANKANHIIDPMVGSGDLLASCLELGATPELVAGIEIDDAAHAACVRRLPNAQCLLGSAFDPQVLAQLPAVGWDLVITNPPYVRYQSFSDKSTAGNNVPSAIEIRTGLLEALKLLPGLDAEDKRLFAHLVGGYSGLSDLAVPSWILCAGLVREGGHMALVVPESWLSRDYATIVHYLLFRWFDIEFVVEDEHASWFEDAQVKTTLVVAKRVKRRVSAQAVAESSSYCHISISADAATAESPIGRLAAPGNPVERTFANEALQWLQDATSHATDLVSVRPVSLKLASRNVVAAASRQKWFTALENSDRAADAVYVPHEIYDWLSVHGLAPQFETFASQRVAVGQGLRTGANGFFYADGTREGDEVALVFTGPLGGLAARAPITIARPALRRQSELPSGFLVSPKSTGGWVLDLRRHALPEDIQQDLVSQGYEPMPNEVAQVIRAAARANFGSEAKPQKIWDLSAVSPNIRQAARGAPTRYWYMLPDFASRHLPDLLLPRVNSGTPKTYLNFDRGCLVDANFSTMWTLPGSRWSATALLALMNSTWAQALLEKSGAVMGGGALKVEATHLRRFPVPRLCDQDLHLLDAFGKRLLAADEEATEVILAIDRAIAVSLGCPFSAMHELRDIALAGQARRARHNGRRGEVNGEPVC